MNDYKTVVINHFSELVEEFGDDVRSLDWGSEAGQKLRFEILSQCLRNSAFSLLDIGCGRGDLLDFLETNGFNVQYTGVDLNDKIIEIAIKKHQDKSAEFKVVDVLKDQLVNKFDYVFASGIFYLKIANNVAFFEEMLIKMLSISNIAIAFNMLSSYAIEKEEHEFYYSPAFIAQKLSELDLKYIIRNDYKKNDFTVYIYK